MENQRILTSDGRKFADLPSEIDKVKPLVLVPQVEEFVREHNLPFEVYTPLKELVLIPNSVFEKYTGKFTKQHLKEWDGESLDVCARLVIAAELENVSQNGKGGGAFGEEIDEEPIKDYLHLMDRFAYNYGWRVIGPLNELFSKLDRSELIDQSSE